MMTPEEIEVPSVEECARKAVSLLDLAIDTRNAEYNTAVHYVAMAQVWATLAIRPTSDDTEFNAAIAHIDELDNRP